jgi:3-oxoacid CoA-transferase subunit A
MIELGGCLSGIPEHLMEAVRESGVTGLTVSSKNAGVDGFGLATLIESRQTTKMIASHVGIRPSHQCSSCSGQTG